jgi:hypothetical protein
LSNCELFRITPLFTITHLMGIPSCIKLKLCIKLFCIFKLSFKKSSARVSNIVDFINNEITYLCLCVDFVMIFSISYNQHFVDTSF